MDVEILPIFKVPSKDLKSLTDSQIGPNYYSTEELDRIKSRSQIENICCSFVLMANQVPVGFRFSFPPGNWKQGKGEQLSPSLWPYDIEETAYFQSLFLKPQFQNQGWGTKLSRMSIETLKSLGAKGIVCHSWVESPGNSSNKYLLSLQFKSVCQYPKYWFEVDYICPRCGKPCVCTAEEMYLDLKEYKY